MAKSAAKSEGGAISAETRFVILHGKDRFLQDEYLRTLREALAAKHGADGFDTVRFDGQQGARIVADILDEARSFGLMQQHKILLVDNADLLVKVDDDDEGAAAPAPVAKGRGKRVPAPQSARELLENYAEDPSASATLVLRASTWRPGNLDKAVAKIPDGGGAVIKCEPPSPMEAVRWAQTRASKRHNSSIGNEAATRLIEAVGTELGRIDTELEKLSLAAGGAGKPITPELVDQMVGVTRQEEFWAIQSTLMQGNARVALSQLDELINVSRHDPVPIVYAYMEAARKVHVAARGQQMGMSVNQYSGALKVFGWGQERDNQIAAIATAGKAAGAVGAAQLLNDAVTTDAQNKSGVGEQVRNVEMLTIRFTDRVRRGR